jgi:signal transduction histidine kinase/CheY-like chemotaxis protein
VGALVPLVVLAWLTTSRAQDAVRDEVTARLRLTTALSSSLIAEQIESVVELLEAHARRPRLVQAVADGDPSRFDAAELMQQVQTLLNAREGTPGTALLDLQGIVRAIPNAPQFIGQDFSARDYYQGLVATDRTYVSEAFKSALGDFFVVTAAAYVRALDADGRSTGEPLAILISGIRLDEVQASVERLASVQGVDLWVTDQSGHVVASPRGNPGALRAVTDVPIGVAVELPLGELHETRLDDTRTLVVRQRIASLDWTVYATIPRARAYEGADSIRATVLGIGAPLGALVCVGIVVLLQTYRRQKRAELDLAAARDAARDASRQKSEFLANMSHEIRTPMNGVVGMTALLLGTDLADHQREYAQTAAHSAEALLEVIDDILDFSKVEAGHIELEDIDVDVRSVVEDVAQLLAATADDKGVDLICQVDATVPAVVRGDPARLRQVLVNLVGNAVKFTDAGDVVARASVVAEDDDTVHVRFEVSDTGIGIPPEARSRLFDAFSQADSSTTRRFGGTGLGLAISQRLVEMMGGRIEVDSTVGVGSTFWFTIPMQRGPGALGRPPKPRGDLIGVRALVVDDHQTGRVVLTEMLRGWGLRPEATETADEALSTLRRAVDAGDPFQVVLIDRNMPRRDGLWLLRAVRADGRLAPIRVLLLTSTSGLGEAADAREAGADAHLTKPVRQGQLYEVLMSTLGDAPTERESGAPEAGRADRRFAGRLLLAEDNKVNQRVAQLMLEQMGFAVDVVPNGAAAVDAVAAGRYDAVLMDCQMPVMDGYEATRTIRRTEPDGERLPIIALTASALESDRERCLAAGMDDHVAKPIRPESLERALSSFVPVTPSDDHEVAALDGEPVLDAVRIDELRTLDDGGTALLRELYDLFAEDVPVRVRAMADAMSAGDIEALCVAAHTLQGAAASLGATQIAAVCRRIQDVARDAPGSVAQLIDTLVQTVDRTNAAVAQEVGEG